MLALQGTLVKLQSQMTEAPLPLNTEHLQEELTGVIEKQKLLDAQVQVKYEASSVFGGYFKYFL